mmetsp:Transcript_32105/g.73418  ORF Transcript_32105/g.73418 Transcript_32105/m.73418 type:complete len:221 (-) Transcript_32105:75-737(-)
MLVICPALTANVDEEQHAQHLWVTQDLCEGPFLTESAACLFRELTLVVGVTEIVAHSSTLISLKDQFHQRVALPPRTSNLLHELLHIDTALVLALSIVLAELLMLLTPLCIQRRTLSNVRVVILDPRPNLTLLLGASFHDLHTLIDALVSLIQYACPTCLLANLCDLRVSKRLAYLFCTCCASFPLTPHTATPCKVIRNLNLRLLVGIKGRHIALNEHSK